MACMSTRSITPTKCSSWPIGIWIGTGLAPRRSRMDSTAAKKFAPVRSILLMNAIRGTLYLSAWRQTVSDSRLDAGDGVEDGDRAVEDAQAALDLDREVHVPGRIDDVDAMVTPDRRRGSRGDRDAALLLLRHPVHRRRAVVDLADLVVRPGSRGSVSRRGLARIDVGHDPDVPERDRARWRLFPWRSKMCPILAATSGSAQSLVGLRHPVDVVFPLERSCPDSCSVHDLVGELTFMPFSRRSRAYVTSQRTASVRARRCGTSTGTW